MSKLTYIRCGDYYIPNLKLSEQPEAPIGKYGRMRQRYLKEHRPGLYSSLILSEKLYPHLLEIDRAARERMDTMLPRMLEAAGVTEELKARDPMRWVGLMNTLKAQVEEMICQGQNLEVRKIKSRICCPSQHSDSCKALFMRKSTLEQ